MSGFVGVPSWLTPPAPGTESVEAAAPGVVDSSPGVPGAAPSMTYSTFEKAGPLPLTLTLSKVEVFRTPAAWLVTARPTKTWALIVTVSEPTCVHVVPLVDLEAVIVLPLRTSRTQTGAPDAPPAVCELTPPVATRRWKARPLPGVSAMNACLEPAASVSRIMTPALAHGFVF